MTSMRMPFGKYRGRRLDDVPLSYLRWLFQTNLQLLHAIADLARERGYDVVDSDFLARQRRRD